MNKYIGIIAGLVISFFSGCSAKEPTYTSVNYQDGKFKNQEIKYEVTFEKMWSATIQFFKDKTPDKVPSEDFQFPIVKLTKNDILNFKDNSVVRFGHSTLLFKVDNKLIMTDPVFSDRASPVSFMGPKRFHKSPIDVKELPFIDILIVSHNHYDHMDVDTLQSLKDNFGHMYVPLGVKQEMIDIGLDGSKITELDWWEEIINDTIKIVATPAQHFSGRGLFDSKKTFWASWVIKSTQVNLYFSSDSGYFKGFKEIGNRYGPFHMTFMENGAYNEAWREIHMLPEDAVQAHLDLKGKIMFPIHNGTFELALHSWYEPFERVLKESNKKDVNLVHPKMGEVISILEYKQTDKWWEN